MAKLVPIAGICTTGVREYWTIHDIHGMLIPAGVVQGARIKAGLM
jgi:hypothetical protein